MSETTNQDLIGVAEALLVTLYLRAVESQRQDGLIKDEKAEALVKKISDAGLYDFGRIKSLHLTEASKRKKTTTALAAMALALAAVLLSGCSLDSWAKVEPGQYIVVDEGAATTMEDAREIQRLDIDRDENLLVLTLVDGSEIAALFVPRDRTEWPAGCPANIQSTRMEVLDIVQDPLTIGAASLSRPILVRDCPRDPERIVLREDGAIGGGGTGCPYPEPCIHFAPRP